MNLCFHHVPKTAGSSLQLRLCHREWIGELDKGSTLVVTPFANSTTLYRVSEDLEFSPNEPITAGFRRRLGITKPGEARIVMGHLTTIHQKGDHYTWLRHPLERDISHWRYDYKNGKALGDTYQQHLRKIGPNFYVAWFWQHYMGRRGGAATMDEAFEEICKQLKKFKRIYNHNDFEKSWDDICEMLNISKEPRLNTNVSTDNFIDNIPQDFKDWHREKNKLDYYIYENFVDYSS